MTAKEPSARIEIHVVDDEVPIDGASPRSEYSAIDNAGRAIAAEVYDKCTVWNSIKFVDYLIRHSPYRIYSIRTDHRREFKGKFAEHLMKLNIPHDLIAPHKV